MDVDGMFTQLVGGAITILKNDGVRQREGWHHIIYEMDNIMVMFETTNQLSITIHHQYITSIITINHQ